jgi:hypothetical protein
VDAELIAYLDQRFAEVRGDIAASAAGVKGELRGEIAASAAALRADISADMTTLRADISAEMTRNIGTVVEDLISKMELIVEGVRTVDHRVDRLGDEMREEFRKVDGRLLRLHARISGRKRRRPGR